MRAIITLTGRTPLLMHRDNVLASDAVKKWCSDPGTKPLSRPGDDRTPPWTWQGYLYHDGSKLTIFADMVQKVMLQASAGIVVKGSKTLKEYVAGGMAIDSEHCRFTVNGKENPLAPIAAIRDEEFDVQCEAVRDMGFDIDVRRAKVGTAKHIRCRAKFAKWQVQYNVTVDNPLITKDRLVTLMELSETKGIGDWRPSSPSPGMYGVFSSKVDIESK